MVSGFQTITMIEFIGSNYMSKEYVKIYLLVCSTDSISNFEDAKYYRTMRLAKYALEKIKKRELNNLYISVITKSDTEFKYSLKEKCFPVYLDQPPETCYCTIEVCWQIITKSMVVSDV